MTKKNRKSNMSRRGTHKKSRVGGKLSEKTTISSASAVIVSSSDVIPGSKCKLEQEEEEQLSSELQSEDAVVVQRPTFHIKQDDFIELSPELASRILYPNPCCFLTTIPVADVDNMCNHTKLNAMALTWICPANNYGGFVFVIHKSRFSARSIVEGSGKFTLSVAHAGLRDVLLACGKVSGRSTDKFKDISDLKFVGSAKICEGNHDPLKPHTNNAFSALENESDSENESEKGVAINLVESNEHIPAPVHGTVAHLSCNHLQHADAADAGHWLVTAQVESAFVHTSYWDGKCFQPKSTDLPPLLSFLGSQRFGLLVPED